MTANYNNGASYTGQSTKRIKRLNQNCTNTICGGGGSSFMEEENSSLNHSSTINLMKVFPNPTSKAFDIEWIENEEGVAQLIMTDLNGRTVFRNSIASILGFNTFTVSQKFTSGLYFITLSNSKEVKVQQLAVYN